ncbi:MAG: class I SAM-dependent methyltransferase, partial [Anaerolineae bacterium]|nr:class I SAM-dependent methyltransferase [Anaerolineae bacterium]
MTITVRDIEFLSSSAGAALLERLAVEDLGESNTLRLLTALRKDYTGEQVGAALEMARLRMKAVDKFGEDARRMFFTREALEQASDPLVRRYRAEVIGAHSVIDACCGIGADSLAFARNGAEVYGFDTDPARIEIARHNVTQLGLNAQFEV